MYIKGVQYIHVCHAYNAFMYFYHSFNSNSLHIIYENRAVLVIHKTIFTKEPIDLFFEISIPRLKFSHQKQ